MAQETAPPELPAHQVISSAPARPFQAEQQKLDTALSDLLSRVKEAPPTSMVLPLAPLIHVTPAADIDPLLPPDQLLDGRPIIEARRPAEVTLQRLERLRGTVEPVLDDVGLPPEIMAVMLVESGCRPDAISPKRARGLWQLMPGTARDYGLTVNRHHDDRTHVRKATRAAAEFLKDLYGRFGDWALALAAYNAGPQAVARAIDKLKKADFWALSAKGLLPQETRDYVPLVLSFMQFLKAN